jgi:hypothetical protein
LNRKDIFDRRLNVLGNKYKSLPLPTEVKLNIKRFEQGQKPKINTAVPKTRYGNEYESVRYNIFGRPLSKQKFNKEDRIYGRKILENPPSNNPADYLETNPTGNSMYYNLKRKIL